MPIIGEKIFDVQLVGLQQAELCYVNLLYAPTVAAGVATMLDFTNAFFADVMPSLQAMSSVAINYIKAKFQSRSPLGGETVTLFTAFAGQVAGDVLPPWDTFSLGKLPSTTVEGTVPTPFEPGRLSLSGVPEAGCNNGLFTVAQQALIQAFCDAVREVTAGGVLYRMYMERNESDLTPPEAAAFVDNVFVRRLGTQLTRKS